MSNNSFLKRVGDLQNELKSPKNQFNNFGKYRYRSEEDILESVKPLNQKYGVLLNIKDDIVLIGERYYIKAIATILDCENSSEKIEVTALARQSSTKKGQNDSQITGTASSYARKYALNESYLIHDTKYSDTDEYKKKKNTEKKKENKQVGRATLLSKWKISGKSEEEFNKWHAKQTAEGKSNNEQDAILTKAVANKKSGKQ